MLPVWVIKKIPVSGDEKKCMDQLNGLRVLSCKPDSLKPGKATTFFNEAVAIFNNSAYKELMTVNDGGSNVRFLTKQDGNGKITEDGHDGKARRCIPGYDRADRFIYNLKDLKIHEHPWNGEPAENEGKSQKMSGVFMNLQVPGFVRRILSMRLPSISIISK